jgi:hypothetical protein
VVPGSAIWRVGLRPQHLLDGGRDSVLGLLLGGADIHGSGDKIAIVLPEEPLQARRCGGARGGPRCYDGLGDPLVGIHSGTPPFVEQVSAPTAMAAPYALLVQ